MCAFEIEPKQLEILISCEAMGLGIKETFCLFNLVIL